VKQIQVITTQNVRIAYELAGLGDRILAFCIDQIVIGTGMWLMGMLVGLATGIFGGGSESQNSFVWAIILFVVPIYLFYTLAMETLNSGQTLGKMALRIKVIDVDGKNPEVLDFIIRWTFRMVDIFFTAGSLACMLIVSGDRAQRLGGRLSNTTVVRLIPRKTLNLDQLLDIERLKDYTPTYPQIRQLDEQEMLTLKAALDRYKKYQNKAHREALFAAVKRVKDYTGIEQGKENTMPFVRTLIQDYVVLTR